jgi:hypothetical protein
MSRIREQDETEDVLGLLSPKPKQCTDTTSHATGTNIVDLHHVLAGTVFAITALFAFGLELGDELLPELFVLLLCNFGSFLL